VTVFKHSIVEANKQTGDVISSTFLWSNHSWQWIHLFYTLVCSKKCVCRSKGCRKWYSR